MKGEHQRILIVKLGALGNVVLSFGPFASIRRHHANAHITLLTTGAYADWMRAAPWFDEVWVDERPEWWDLPGWLRLRRRLFSGRFDRVYDLQTSGRSSRYFQLMFGQRPEWSGIAAGCSHPDSDPNRNHLHDVVRQYGQLRAAGVTEQEPADLSWSRGDLNRLKLPAQFVLLSPGSSPHRLLKRWPVEHYRTLAMELSARGLAPVVVGSRIEAELAQRLVAGVPGALDLTGQTSFGDLVDLARSALLAIGNDTGPMHVFAAANCPSVVLFSRDSDPDLCAPKGPHVRVLREYDLARLDVRPVLMAVTELLEMAPV